MRAMPTTSCFFSCFFLYLLRFSLPVLAVDSLLVFGDSYLDTGNLFKLTNGYPPIPYGLTYPGSPSGRFSDGIIFTDTFAEYLQIRPVPALITALPPGTPAPPSGINFAVGGAGLFVEPTNGTNLMSQVDKFAAMVQSNAISTAQLASSVVLLSIGGNDYVGATNNVTANDPNFVATFAPRLLNETQKQLDRIYALGARNFAILNLPPAQCAPRVTNVINNAQCLPGGLANLDSHNNGLRAIRNRLVSVGATATIMDLNSAMLYIISNPSCFGFSNQTVLKSCCAGEVKNSLGQSGCGAYNLTTKEPLFSVCSDPKASLYWDGLHPDQAGWKAISSLLFFGNNYTIPSSMSLCKAVMASNCSVANPVNTSVVSAVGVSEYCYSPFLGEVLSPTPAPANNTVGIAPTPPDQSGAFGTAPSSLLLFLLSISQFLFWHATTAI